MCTRTRMTKAHVAHARAWVRLETVSFAAQGALEAAAMFAPAPGLIGAGVAAKLCCC